MNAKTRFSFSIFDSSFIYKKIVLRLSEAIHLLTFEGKNKKTDGRHSELFFLTLQNN